MERRLLVETEEVDGAAAPAGLRTEDYGAVLRHELIPFISWPYEWTPGMLRDAALLTLDVTLEAIEGDLMVKDATPYNVQFRGARPVFVDVGSFERLVPGEPWAGYRQFCMQFLYPLMLQAWKGVPFQPWMRGALEGITPTQMRGLISFRDRFRKGATLHVVAHSRLDRKYSERGLTGGEVKQELKRAGFGKEMLRANVRKMRNIVESLEWSPPASVWTRYREIATYTGDEDAVKMNFVRKACAASPGLGLVWDLGANDGRYSRIAAEHADYVLAVDLDPSTVEILYRDLKDDAGRENILPLVMNLTDPSPGIGWRGAERRPFEERGKPDMVLALALLHHVSITGNVPMREIVDWLRSLDAALVVEFMTREDPMVKKLLSAKRVGHADYDQPFFEQLLGERFDVREQERLPSATRVLYHATPR